MSSLKYAEKCIFEYLFDMSNGCVLNFSTNSFGDFFKDYHIDINSDKYLDPNRSGSKANRLRTFWDIESDEVVGQILLELLHYWTNCQYIKKQDKDYEIYPKAKKIISRLLNKPLDSELTITENTFLKKEFGQISFNELSLNNIDTKIIEDRFQEAIKCFKSDAFLAVIILIGSILEALLIGFAYTCPQKFYQSAITPTYQKGKVFPIKEWKLSQLIDVAYEVKLISLDVKKHSHSLRDFRNFIHPEEQRKNNFQPDR